MAHPREQEVNKNIDNTKNIKNQKSNESTAENKLIFNGRAWKITFEGRSIDDRFTYKGLKVIAYIIERKGKSISPIELTFVVDRGPITKENKKGYEEYLTRLSSFLSDKNKGGGRVNR
jgi:hypothetical protein